MTDNITLTDVCECDPFEACYRVEGAAMICVKCGKPRPVYAVIEADTACPRCQARGVLDNGQTCDCCEGHGYLW